MHSKKLLLTRSSQEHHLCGFPLHTAESGIVDQQIIEPLEQVYFSEEQDVICGYCNVLLYTPETFHAIYIALELHDACRECRLYLFS